jgi:hypothetical protein
MLQAFEVKHHSHLLQEVAHPFLYAAVKHLSNCTHVDVRLVAGGNAILVRQLLALGATGSREALTTAVMFSQTAVAQLLQMHCRMQHYMGVLAARYFLSHFLLQSFVTIDLIP